MARRTRRVLRRLGALLFLGVVLIDEQHAMEITSPTWPKTGASTPLSCESAMVLSTQRQC
jgi:hypothetical protein